ncbi:hypothetical protein GOODEAATRI_003507 [Goodea atripinnis]|uniref:ANK_REP_REGION domain-containing protein n=1 Tax=Goodea atripinnis TaxID=208336 RepID=A0ABV0PKH3_9TELE
MCRLVWSDSSTILLNARAFDSILHTEMDWNEGGNGHGHMHDGCQHGHSGHSHSHGPRAAAFGGMTNMYSPAYGQMGKGADPVMDISQQPKKRSQMDDSSSWDIVKATQYLNRSLAQHSEIRVQSAGIQQLFSLKAEITVRRFGILERCKELVEAGYDVRQPDKENVTLLHWAAINNRSELVNATVQVLFTLNATALLYYFLRTCRTDPGFIKATEEQRKMNVVVLAEAGCLDPRIFCTSCMVSYSTGNLPNIMKRLRCEESSLFRPFAPFPLADGELDALRLFYM